MLKRTARDCHRQEGWTTSTHAYLNAPARFQVMEYVTVTWPAS